MLAWSRSIFTVNKILRIFLINTITNLSLCDKTDPIETQFQHLKSELYVQRCERVIWNIYDIRWISMLKLTTRTKSSSICSLDELKASNGFSRYKDQSSNFICHMVHTLLKEFNYALEQFQYNCFPPWAKRFSRHWLPVMQGASTAHIFCHRSDGLYVSIDWYGLRAVSRYSNWKWLLEMSAWLLK